MATSKTQMLNLALTSIGENVVTDINDTSQDAARKGKLLFEPTVREVLRDGVYNCVKQRIQLAADPTPPFGWSYAYTMPQDCVRVLQMNGHTIEENYVPGLYEIEGRQILTNDDTCKIAYIEYTDDVTVFDPLLDRAIITLLASYLAEIIPVDAELAIAKLNQFEKKKKSAKRVDGNEANKRRWSRTANSTWVASRRIQPGE